jgi:hypothetical protein
MHEASMVQPCRRSGKTRVVVIGHCCQVPSIVLRSQALIRCLSDGGFAFGGKYLTWVATAAYWLAQTMHEVKAERGVANSTKRILCHRSAMHKKKCKDDWFWDLGSHRPRPSQALAGTRFAEVELPRLSDRNFVLRLHLRLHLLPMGAICSINNVPPECFRRLYQTEYMAVYVPTR